MSGGWLDDTAGTLGQVTEDAAEASQVIADDINADQEQVQTLREARAQARAGELYRRDGTMWPRRPDTD